MEMKPGYKHTVVGVIPEDWSLKQITDFATTVASGKSHVISEFGDYPVFGSTGIIGSCFKSDHSGTAVLIARVGANAGKLTVVSGEYGVTDNTIIVRIDESLDHGFFWRQLESRRLNSMVFGSGQPLITGTQIKSIRLPIPPTKAEQEAIAGALSDADALIESLEQLLAKKRQIKQGTMQELFTGKKRLPGFIGRWTVKPLGNVVAHCSSGATPYRGRPEYYKGNVKWISSGELNYNVIEDTIEHISQEAVKQTNLKIHPAGTFLMAITGLEAEGTRGACGIVGSPAATNQSCMAIYPSEDLSTAFLYHYYVLRGKALALEYCQGTKQQSYTAKLVRLLPITIPPTVEEQIAIATVLSDMDCEIQSVETRLAKARQLKQGMMQELLTGRIRLV